MLLHFACALLCCVFFYFYPDTLTRSSVIVVSIILHIRCAFPYAFLSFCLFFILFCLLFPFKSMGFRHGNWVEGILGVSFCVLWGYATAHTCKQRRQREQQASSASLKLFTISPLFFGQQKFAFAHLQYACKVDISMGGVRGIGQFILWFLNCGSQRCIFNGLPAVLFHSRVCFVCGCFQWIKQNWEKSNFKHVRACEWNRNSQLYIEIFYGEGSTCFESQKLPGRY